MEPPQLSQVSDNVSVECYFVGDIAIIPYRDCSHIMPAVEREAGVWKCSFYTMREFGDRGGLKSARSCFPCICERSYMVIIDDFFPYIVYIPYLLHDMSDIID